ALLDPLHLPAALTLGGDLPRPRHAYREALGQLLQGSFTTVVGLQQLAPQIIPIRFRHCPFAAESRRNPLYTYIETALNSRSVGAFAGMAVEPRSRILAMSVDSNCLALLSVDCFVEQRYRFPPT